MIDAELLALHREIVEIPSISGDESAIRDRLEMLLASRGAPTIRIGENLVSSWGRGPVVCLNSHLDTVPPCPGWTRPPHRAVVEAGRVHGLGAQSVRLPDRGPAAYATAGHGG